MGLRELGAVLRRYPVAARDTPAMIAREKYRAWEKHEGKVADQARSDPNSNHKNRA